MSNTAYTAIAFFVSTEKKLQEKLQAFQPQTDAKIIGLTIFGSLRAKKSGGKTNQISCLESHLRHFRRFEIWRPFLLALMALSFFNVL